MGFREMVRSDNLKVFLDLTTFGELRTVTFDGKEFKEIHCVISQVKEQDRVTVMSDHEQGIYRVTAIFHCRLCDIGKTVPEKGRKFGVYDPDDAFLRWFYVAQASCDIGMVRLELEALDE